MSITDGSVYCARCGDDRTVCYLCADLPPALVERGFSRISYEDEKEIMMQTRSIRVAAAKRQGF